MVLKDHLIGEVRFSCSDVTDVATISNLVISNALVVRTYYSKGTYSLMLSLSFIFQWKRTLSLGDRDSIKASITGPPALHCATTRPVLRSQKPTSPVEY